MNRNRFPVLDLGFTAFRAAIAARPALVNAPSNETLLADIATIPTTLPSMTSALGRRRELLGAHAG